MKGGLQLGNEKKGGVPSWVFTVIFLILAAIAVGYRGIVGAVIGGILGAILLATIIAVIWHSITHKKKKGEAKSERSE
jgi:O-antigen/teichoic acid export membrane protein